MEREDLPIYSAATTPEITQSKTLSAKRPGWIKWTTKDIEAFEEGRKMYGNRWKKIAEHMGNKTPKAVRSYYRRTYENKESNQKTKGSLTESISKIESNKRSECNEHLTPKEKQHKNKAVSEKRSRRKKKCLENNEERPLAEDPFADFRDRNCRPPKYDSRTQRSDEEDFGKDFFL